MTTRWVEVAPGISVRTDAAESEPEKNARLRVEAVVARRRTIAEALREGPFPATLTQWARRAGECRDEEIRDGGQIVFLRDVLMRAVCEDEVEATAYRPSNGGEPGVVSCCEIIGTHTSQSCVLPVVRITPLGLGFVAWLRGNFYNWMVSIETTDGAEVDIDHGTLFDPDAKHAACYCEGFPAGAVFGPYARNRARFTVCLDGQYEVFAMLHLISRWARRTRDERAARWHRMGREANARGMR
jgi:hypothetical protein